MNQPRHAPPASFSGTPGRSHDQIRTGGIFELGDERPFSQGFTGMRRGQRRSAQSCSPARPFLHQITRPIDSKQRFFHKFQFAYLPKKRLSRAGRGNERHSNSR